MIMRSNSPYTHADMLQTGNALLSTFSSTRGLSLLTTLVRKIDRFEDLGLNSPKTQYHSQWIVIDPVEVCLAADECYYSSRL